MRQGGLFLKSTCKLMVEMRCLELVAGMAGWESGGREASAAVVASPGLS